MTVSDRSRILKGISMYTTDFLLYIVCL